MHIALITKNFSRFEKDAAITTVLNLAKYLKQKGHNPIIISERGFKNYTGYERSKSYELINGIEVFRPYGLPWFRTEKWFLDPAIFFNRILAPGLGTKYVEKNKKINFDIIHSFGAAPFLIFPNAIAKIFCRGARTIHSVKAISAHQKYLFSPGSPYFHWLYNIVDKVTVPLPSMKKRLIKFGVKANRIVIMNSFIDLKKFHPKNKKKLRKKYGWNNKKTVLYFGPLGPYKGTDYLLNSIPLIKKNVSRLRVILAHPAYFTANQKKYVSTYNVDNCIELVEKRIKIEDYINMADVIVLPYTTITATEANPLCLLESIACKTPVVTTCLPELKEILQPNKDVIMARPKDSKNLAENVIKLLNNTSLQKKLANHAFKKIYRFDITRIGEKIIRIYNEIKNTKSE